MSLHKEIRIVRSDASLTFNQDIKAIVADKEIDGHFLYYALAAQKADLLEAVEAAGHGTGVLHTHKVENVPIPKLSLSEQSSIVMLLSAIDAAIELNRQMNVTLEAMSRAIFKDWFVDFGPTRAKAEGRAPYLASGIWSLFPARFDDEEKPEGWRDGTLTDVSDLNSESWFVQNRPCQLEYVDLSNTKWGVIEDAETYAWEAAPSRARRVLRPGDTIVGTVRPGNGSYALVDLNGLTGSTGFAVLRPKEPVFRALVYCAATAKDNIDRLAHLADGGAYPAVRPDVVAATPLVLGSTEILSAFSAVCGPMIDELEANKQQTRILAQIRDLLLPKLMSGEIRVREAERLVEALA